jgi:8-amino-7-oxononanoate synthase
MNPESWIAQELSEMTSRGLLRELRPLPGLGGKIEIDGRTVLNFSSNDYLNLAGDPALKQAAADAIERYGCGATASRLMAGTSDLHTELEQKLAELKRREAALVFSSGYAANVGTIGALIGPGDAAFCDRLDHASILDGVKLSGARLFRYRHCDCDDLASMLDAETGFGKRLVISDTVFSMDGDVAPVADLIAVCRDRGAMLMVDEAHATGVFGPHGSGVAAEADPQCEITVCMGTLSKALGGGGGFVAGSIILRDLLINRARSFVYSTGLPPASVASALAAIEQIRGHPNMGAELLARVERFKAALHNLGFDTFGSTCQIVPVLVGSAEKATALSRLLMERGILAVAVRPPTVPAGSARLRLSVTLAHSDSDLEFAAETLGAAARELGLP